MDAFNQELLLKQMKSGDRQALERIYRELGPNVLRFLRSIDCPAPEDILHETFIAFDRQVHQLRPNSTILAWLFKVARNKAFKTSRSHTEMPPEELESIQVSSDDLDMKLAIQQAVQSLEEPFRSTLVLFHWEGMALEEIAEITSAPVNTVKTRLFRARQQLKTSLGSPKTNQSQKIQPKFNTIPFKSIMRDQSQTLFTYLGNFCSTLTKALFFTIRASQSGEASA